MEESLGRRSQDMARKFSASFFQLLDKIWKRLIEAKDALMAQREGNKRMLIWVGLGLNFLQMCCSMGVGSLVLLFVKRKPLSWTDVQYGYFQAYISALAAFGMTIGIILTLRDTFNKDDPTVPFAVNKLPYLKDSPSKDTIIVMFGCVSSAAYFSFFAFSTTTSMVFASGAFMLFANLFLPGFRTFFSKLVGQEETARIFAAVGMLENFTPMIAALVFNNIYNLSLHFNFAGFAFLVSAVLHIPVLIGMGFIHTMMVRDSEMGPGPERLVENMERNEQGNEGMMIDQNFEPENPAESEFQDNKQPEAIDRRKVMQTTELTEPRSTAKDA